VGSRRRLFLASSITRRVPLEFNLARATAGEHDGRRAVGAMQDGIGLANRRDSTSSDGWPAYARIDFSDVADVAAISTQMDVSVTST
jgi:hypothetical protein